MSIVFYTKQDEYDLVNTGQDCIGWSVVDQAGGEVGKVTEMLIETNEMKVDSILVGDGVRIPAEDINLQNGRVVARGILHPEQYDETKRSAVAAKVETYKPVERGAKAANITGVTREATNDEITLPIIEEQLVVGKRTVEKGGVSVRTTMTEKPVEEQVTLHEEKVHVERRPVDRPVDNADDAFVEGTFDVNTQAEVPVVSKQARVVEEVVVGKEMTEHTETVRDTVKRTDVDVDKIDVDDVKNRDNR